MGTEEGAGIARSGRDLKCPDCGANNRADAEWCWQCLGRFPEKAPQAEQPVAPATEPQTSDPRDEARLRREAMSELAGIAGDEDVAARLSSLLGGTGGTVAPSAPPAETNGTVKNGSGSPRSAAAVTATPVEAVIAGDRGAIEIKGEEITWTCSRCDTVNSFESNVCDVCSASFAEVLKEPEKEERVRDPNTVALVSLFFPGAGHAYLGMWGQAVARAVISLWVVATAIFAAAQGAAQSMVMAVVFGVVSFGLWIVSAHDGYREAQKNKKAVLLRDKLFLYLVMGLLLLSVIMVFSLAMGARTV